MRALEGETGLREKKAEKGLGRLRSLSRQVVMGRAGREDETAWDGEAARVGGKEWKKQKVGRTPDSTGVVKHVEFGVG